MNLKKKIIAMVKQKPRKVYEIIHQLPHEKQMEAENVIRRLLAQGYLELEKDWTVRYTGVIR